MFHWVCVRKKHIRWVVNEAKINILNVSNYLTDPFRVGTTRKKNANLLIGWEKNCQPTDWLGKKLPTNWLVGKKIANLLIGWEKIANLLIGWEKIANLLIGWEKIANLLIGWEKIASLLISWKKMFFFKVGLIKYNLSCDMTKPTKWVCAQRKLRSAWAFVQSDQSLRCPHEESLSP